MTDLYGPTYDELQQLLKGQGLDPCRITQVIDGLYKSKAFDFKNITTLPKDIKELLISGFHFFTMKPEKVSKSSVSGTAKFLFQLQDQTCIESVAIPNTKKSSTFCLSSQAGCPLKCTFCASGYFGLERDLSVSEIIEQIMFMKKTGYEPTNIVFMGMGEPLLNTDNIIAAVRCINDPKLINIGMRNITISTAGIIEGIRKLSTLDAHSAQIRLSVSLHFPYQDMRAKYMPVSSSNPLPELISVLKEYQEKTDRLITFEYILFKDLNDNLQIADDMRKLLAGLDYKINLIPYNEIKGFPFKAPVRERAEKFFRHLLKKGVKATLRVKRGDDINAACGQLRMKEIQN